VGWELLSFTWSGSLAQAWDEFKVQRMLVTPLLLWPILDRTPWLVMAALAGVFAQNGVQVLQEIGWVSMQTTGEGRLRGLIHPIHSGMWFGAAMIWHLSAALNTRGWWRWIALALIVVSCAGLLATGSRGPWIATVVAFPAALLVIPMRRPHTGRAALAIAGIGAGALVVVSVFALVTAHSRPLGDHAGMITPRVREALREISEARERHVYWTSTGLRIGLWRWAVEVWRSSPLIGVGAGGFPRAYQQLDSFRRTCDIAIERSMNEEVTGYAQAKAAGEDVTKLRTYRRGFRLAENRIDYLTRDHAHSTYLHTLASTGVIGVALLALVLIVVLRQAWRDRPDHPYSDGMLLVLVCWVVGAQFDCYELNGHQLGLLGLIAALTLPGRPPVRWQWSAVDDERLLSTAASGSSPDAPIT
jgi:O-antigen ligase